MSHREGASSTTEVRDPKPQELSVRFVDSGSHRPLLQVLNSASDAVFGTRSYTPGARLQLPRKVPLRVEPKSFFGETPVCQALEPEIYTTVYRVIFCKIGSA